MINNNYDILKEVTLVIPSHYRQKFLQRNLNYYLNVGLPILVADSTDIAFSDHKQYLQQNIFHYKFFLPYQLKLYYHYTKLQILTQNY